ncbi:lysophospholipid acyltransferase family protein [Solitalea lacus]|uniref:lysophospholipid acyltransferase family protein n=1 Tax=Solitalea lacus TaxID=2911172 RepID=UPI001ED9FF82|nr:lysophospholipid acyltransferase family protein [Solitalea lacus]UKJ06323.1 lysophospholipid acyltransferase family protein [Solitalea lacus]
MKKITFYLALPLLYLIALLPFPILYLVSDFFKIIIFDLVGYRKKVILTNLKNSFPNKSDQEIKAIASKFYRNFTDMLLECVKMLTISEKQLNEVFVVSNKEIVKNYHDAGRSVIGVVGHMINWELACLAHSNAFTYPSLIVYKPLQNENFDKLVLNMRTRFGAVLVPMKQTFRKLTEYRNKPFNLILAGDQYPGKGESVYKTTFLNQETYVFLGTEKIAKMTNSAIVFCDLRKVKRGKYAITYVPLFENPKDTADGEITETHIRYLDKVIHEQPDIWLWSHRRWK